jgi:hypothetical protein
MNFSPLVSHTSAKPRFPTGTRSPDARRRNW